MLQTWNEGRKCCVTIAEDMACKAQRIYWRRPTYRCSWSYAFAAEGLRERKGLARMKRIPGRHDVLVTHGRNRAVCRQFTSGAAVHALPKQAHDILQSPLKSFRSQWRLHQA